MIKDNVLFSSTKFILLEIIGDLLYLPIWWYTAGLFRIGKTLLHSVNDVLDSFSIRILFRHLLTPMYGDYSWQGRAISFCVRVVHFFIMFFIAFIWITITLAFGLLWVLFPMIVLYSIGYQFFDFTDQHIIIQLFHGVF